ncbi:hypothetical protein J3F83DRAFT_767728 [Trichoderma novae-zelandiae]
MTALRIGKVPWLPTEPPSIYVAITGVIHRKAWCSMSVLRLYIHPTQEIYMMDAQVLDDECFSTPGKGGKTLRDILESFSIPKVFFDVRDHSHVLFRRFEISLQFVLDLQLMELATCYNASRRLVKNWKTCVEKDAGLEIQKRLAGDGRISTVLAERPLAQEAQEYLARDLHLLPRLWACYDAKMTMLWKSRVVEASAERVGLSQSQFYLGTRKVKELGPPCWRYL